MRARSGYCNARQPNILDGTPVEKQLEMRAQEAQGGGLHPSFQAPYFYTGPNVARVNLAMDIPQEMFKFDKDKGKYHSSLNVLGIAYRDDGTVGARFSDQVKLDLEKDDWKTNVRLQPFDQVYIGRSHRCSLERCLPPWLRPLYEDAAMSLWAARGGRRGHSTPFAEQP